MRKIREKKILGKIAVLTIFSLLNFPVGVLASSLKSKKEEAKAVKNQLDSLQVSLNKVAAEYGAAQEKLWRIESQRKATENKLEEAQAELIRCQENLSERMNAIYRDGGIGLAEVIFGSDTFTDFLVNLELVTKIGQADSSLIKRTKELKAEIEKRKKELEAQKAEQKKVVSSLAAMEEEFETKFAKQRALLSGVEGEIAKLEAEEKARTQLAYRSGGSRSGGSRTVSRSGSTGCSRGSGGDFPVAGPNAFSNDWGAPRSGGRRHQGNDIMASQGTPAVAAVSGTVERRSGGSAGLYVILHGDNGTNYYYMHLSSYGASGHVSAGTTVGYVGSTGNASGGASHLHYEVHPGGGGAVNPYSYLTGACK